MAKGKHSRIWLFLFLSVFAISCQKDKDPCTHFEGTSMTMPYRITIGKKLSKRHQTVVAKVIDQTFEEVDQIFNNWNPNSEISKLNQSKAGTLIPLSPPLQELLTLCGNIVTISGGRFDPTIESLGRLWREALTHKKMPSTESLQIACDGLGWNQISIHNGIFQKHSSDTKLDLCGITKGLCIDWIVNKLQKLGYNDLFVEWSGEIRASGHHPANRDWEVEVDPRFKVGGKPIAPIPLRNQALSTSFVQNPKVWRQSRQSNDSEAPPFLQIIDPLTAQPIEKSNFSVAAATVIAPNGALADALSTAAILFPTQKEAESFAKEVVDLYPEVSFWIISHRAQ